MRGSEDFARTIRTGSRSARPTLVVHCAVRGDGDGSRVGFVVAKSVGNAVTRNAVRRRLRGVAVEQRDSLPPGRDVVVRALPAAASATYAQLSQDYGSALESACRRVFARGQAGGVGR